MRGRVLIAEDDRSMCETLESGLVRRGFEVSWRTAADDAFVLLQSSDFDVVVADLRMQGMDGLQLCERVVANWPDIPVLVITAFGSLDSAIAAIRSGAYDFITKPFDIEILEMALERATQHRVLRAEVKRLQLAASGAEQVEGVIGESAPMLKLYDLLRRLGNSDAAVLITGETGTGKEILARALHQQGAGKDGPFIAVNCAALPETLLESELFGHIRGAFTDAKTAKTGLFVQANGGTLFLDEIGELPLGLQPKLLRALQERAVRPVGGEVEVRFNARIVSATNRDLQAAVEERRFREDLFFRVNVISLEVPPLRSRGNDVLLLAQHFLQRCSQRTGKQVVGLSAAVAERLLAYSWPGNVRELQNAMERAVALARFEEVTVDDLPEKIRNYKASHVLLASDNPGELVPMEEVERRYILRVLEAVGGHRGRAARVLGLDRKTLYRKLERYGVMKKGEPSAS